MVPVDRETHWKQPGAPWGVGNNSERNGRERRLADCGGQHDAKRQRQLQQQ